jgi:hypothetical protein
MTLRDLFLKVDKEGMNKAIAYCKPNIVVLGRIAEMICATHIKGPTGLIEAIRWRILPVYDLDE